MDRLGAFKIIAVPGTGSVTATGHLADFCFPVWQEEDVIGVCDKS